MARPIDEKIVKMTLDNDKFKREAANTVESLGKINTATSGLDSINLSTIAQGISNIESRFSGTGVVIASVLKRMTDAAIDTGKRLYGAVMGPVISGGKARAQNIEQAKFQFEGLGMDIDAAMSDALYAVKGTAYGLDEAARAASMLGASGITLGDDMKSALRGISGVAAMTNSSYSDMAGIFGTVAGQGKLMTMQMRQIESRGINVAATMGKAWGKTEAEIREMVTDGKVSFEMFSEAMNESFGEQATKANQTFAGSLSNMKAALSRVGASVAGDTYLKLRDVINTVTPVIDDFSAAFKPLVDAILVTVDAIGDGLIGVLKKVDFKKFAELGGVTNIVNAFKNTFEALSKVFGIVGHAYKTIFPESFMDRVIRITKAISDFSDRLKMNSTEAGKLSTIFKGFFAVINIGMSIAKEIGKVMLSLIPEGLVNDVFELAVKLSKSVIAFNEVFDASKLFSNGIERLATIIEKLRDKLKAFDIFDDLFETSGVEESTNRFGALSIVLERIGQMAKDLAAPIKDFIGSLTTKDIMGGGFLAAAFIMITQIRKLVQRTIGAFSDIGALTSIPNFIINISYSLKIFANNVKAKSIFTIAASLGVLAASMYLLSKLKWEDIGKGLVVFGLSLVGINSVISTMSKLDITGFKGLQIAIMITTVAVAFGIITIALKQFKDMDIDSVMTGVMGIGLVMTIMVVSLKSLTKGLANVRNLKAGQTAVLLITLSIAIGMLSKSMVRLGEMDTDSMIRGAIGLTGLMVILGGAFAILAKIKPPSLKSLASFVVFLVGLQSAAVAMIIFSAGLHILIGAIRKLGEMDLPVLQQGIIGVTAVLVGMMIAMRLSKSSLGGAASLVIVTGVLWALIPVLKIFGQMPIPMLVTGLIAMAGALGILVAALHLANGTLLGSAALLVASVALNMLVIPLTAFAALGIKGILVSLLGMAGAFGVLGLAGLLLTPVIPQIILLSASLIAIGIATVLAGVGLGLMATGLVSFVTVLVTSVSAIMAGFEMFLTGLIELVPKVGELISALVLVIVKTLLDSAPVIIVGASLLIVALLNGLSAALPDIMMAGLNMILALVKGLIIAMPVLIEAAILLMVAFVDGLADGIEKNGPKLIKSIMGLVGEILILVSDALIAVADAIFGGIPGISKKLEEGAEASRKVLRERFAGDVLGKDMTDDVVKGVDKGNPEVKKAWDKVGKESERGILASDMMGIGEKKGGDFGSGALSKLKDTLFSGTSLSDSLGKGAGSFDMQALGSMEGMDFSKGLDSTQIEALMSGKDISTVLGTGLASADTKSIGAKEGQDMADGIASKTGAAKSAASGVASSAKSGLTVDTKSSGSAFALGFINSVAAYNNAASRAGAGIANSAKTSMNRTLNIQSPSKETAKSGGHFGQGFINGIIALKAKAGTAAKGLAETAMSAMDGFIDKIAENFATDEPHEFTMKPVVDLSDVSAYPDQKFGLTPDASRAKLDLAQSVDLHRQNGNKSRATEYSTTNQTTSNQTYEIHVDATGDMSYSKIKEIANKIQTEIKNANDRDKMSKGELVYY